MPTRVVVPIVAAPVPVASDYARISGTGFVDASGAPIKPAGYNVGGWLFIEKFFMEPDDSNLAGTGVTENETTITNNLNAVYAGHSVPYGGSTGTQFFASWRDNFITNDDVVLMAADGAKVIRVGISDVIVTDGRALPYLDNLITWCRNLGMMVVLDMGTMPGCFNTSPNCGLGSQSAALWGNDANKAAAIAAWVTLATRYANEVAVFGYDLIGEPSNVSNDELREFYKALITAIRAVDQHHILFLEGNSFALDSVVFQDRWLLSYDDNSAYSVHLYRASGGPPCDSYANDVSAIADYASTVIAPLVSHGRPFFIGEFGGNCSQWVNAACDQIIAGQASGGCTFASTYFSFKGMRPTAGGENTKVIYNLNSGNVTTPGTPRYIWANLMNKLQNGTDYTQQDWDDAFAVTKTANGLFHYRTVPQGHLQDFFDEQA